MNEYMGIPSEVPLGRNSHTAPQGRSELPDNPSTQIQQPDVESENGQFPSKDPRFGNLKEACFTNGNVREPLNSHSSYHSAGGIE